jgi:hypothetical protein
MRRIGVLTLLAWLGTTSVARGDGGTVRCSRQVEGYQVTVFTEPTPLRAGRVDFSILVQDAAGQARPDVPVVVEVYPHRDPTWRWSAGASREEATNKLFRAVNLNLSEEGRWHIHVIIWHDPAPLCVEFDLDVGEPPPAWLDVAPWVGLPVAVVLLFALHRWLVRRQR